MGGIIICRGGKCAKNEAAVISCRNWKARSKSQAKAVANCLAFVSQRAMAQCVSAKNRQQKSEGKNHRPGQHNENSMNVGLRPLAAALA